MNECVDQYLLSWCNFTCTSIYSVVFFSSLFLSSSTSDIITTEMMSVCVSPTQSEERARSEWKKLQPHLINVQNSVIFTTKCPCILMSMRMAFSRTAKASTAPTIYQQQQQQQQLKSPIEEFKTNEASQTFQTTTEMKTLFFRCMLLFSKQLDYVMNASSHFDSAGILSKRCNSIIDDGLSTQINARYTLNAAPYGMNEKKTAKKKIWKADGEAKRESKKKNMTFNKNSLHIFSASIRWSVRLVGVLCVRVVFSLLRSLRLSIWFAFYGFLLLHTNCELFLHHCCLFLAIPFFVCVEAIQFVFFLCCDQWFSAPISVGFVTNTHTKHQQQQRQHVFRFVTKETNKVLVN